MTQGVQRRISMRLVNDESEGMWKETMFPILKYCLRIYPRQTRQQHEKAASVQPVFLPNKCALTVLLRNRLKFVRREK